MGKDSSRVRRNWAVKSTTDKKRGDRTFKTQEAAKEYMKEHGLSGSLVAAKKGKKFKIVQD